MARFGALTDLEFDHLDLVVGSDAREFVRVERAVPVSAAEISGPNLPDQVAAMLAVVGADAALSGVMREAALFRPGVQRAHCVGTERAKAHRGDIENGRRIGLGAIRTPDGDPELIVPANLWRHGMVDPLIAIPIDILLSAERALVQHHLCPLIDHSAGVAAEGHTVLLALEKVLTHLRPDLFQQETQMRGDRIIAQNRVALLHEIANAEYRQAAKNNDR